jgi:GNAT superfamily N-acetyltransferase
MTPRKPVDQESLAVIRITEWPADALDPLVEESEREGFRFVRRLKDDWLSGSNRFSKPGEALFGVFDGKCLLAVGGISRESSDFGRLRRFYVKADQRRRGVGRLLIQHILAFAAPHYSRVVLHTDTINADRFYQSLGFARTALGGDITHQFEL